MITLVSTTAALGLESNKAKSYKEIESELQQSGYKIQFKNNEIFEINRIYRAPMSLEFFWKVCQIPRIEEVILMDSKQITEFWGTQSTSEEAGRQAVKEFLFTYCNIFQLRDHLKTEGEQYSFFKKNKDGKWELNENWWLYTVENSEFTDGDEKYSCVNKDGMKACFGSGANTKFPVKNLYEAYKNQEIENESFIETFEVLLLDGLFTQMIYNGHQAYKKEDRTFVENPYRCCEVMSDNSIIAIINQVYFQPPSRYDQIVYNNITCGEIIIQTTKKLKKLKAEYISLLQSARKEDSKDNEGRWGMEIEILEKTKLSDFPGYFERKMIYTKEYNDIINEFLSLNPTSEQETVDVFDKYKSKLLYFFNSNNDKHMVELLKIFTNYNALKFFCKEYSIRLNNKDMIKEICSLDYVDESITEEFLKSLRSISFIKDAIGICDNNKSTDEKFKELTDRKFFYLKYNGVSVSRRMNEIDFIIDAFLRRSANSHICTYNGVSPWIHHRFVDNKAPKIGLNKNDQDIWLLSEYGKLTKNQIKLPAKLWYYMYFLLLLQLY